MTERKYGAIFVALAVICSLPACVLLPTKKYSPSKGECHDYSGLPSSSGPYSAMVWVDAGDFIFGNDYGHVDKDSGHFDVFSEEAGAHEASVDGFWIDVHEVSNAQFAKFVQATGYVSVAERVPRAEWFPKGFPKEKMVPGSAVFVAPKDNVSDFSNINQWWVFVEGANWRHPLGPSSTIRDKMNHPVVQVTYEDAKAYADWAGRELPTEAQWEYAAKGGLKLKKYSWGNSMRPHKMWMANTFQGDFPFRDSGEDGFVGTAPVGCYPPNNFGLYDVAGNVWEIVADNYRPGHMARTTKNPQGPAKSFDPHEPKVKKHVIKGGSYLCSPGFCMRYRPSSRQAQDFTMGTSHVGFRTVINGRKDIHAKKN